MTKGEETRQEIIRKAASLFNQRGFAGTSMQDVMQATGLGKGGLYRHFSAKQELAVEAFGYSVAQAFAARLAHADKASDAFSRLHAMIEGFVERPSPVPGGCPLMNTAVDSDDTNPELRMLALQSLKAWKAWIVKTVEEGKLEGSLRRDTDSGKLANQIIATLEGALLISRLEKHRLALADAADYLKSVIGDRKERC